MANPEPDFDSKSDAGTTRADLVQRLELMEQLIAEGRQYTGRNAWIFVLWGVVDLTAWVWQNDSPQLGGRWAWPICLTAGVVLTLVGKMMQKSDQGYSRNDACSRVMGVWAMMGLAMGTYTASAILTHFSWQYSYIAGLLMMLGMAHAISAMLLRWRIQGLVAAIYWAGGVAIFAFNSWRATNAIMLFEMGIVMMLFGLYAMWREPKPSGLKGARA
jgi:multisubunit Na+/H+ antiporter MnhB subunit